MAMEKFQPPQLQIYPEDNNNSLVEEYLVNSLGSDKDFSLETSISETINKLKKHVIELNEDKSKNMQNIMKTLQVLKAQLSLNLRSPYPVQIRFDDRTNIRTIFESLAVFLPEDFDIEELKSYIKYVNSLKHVLDQTGFAITSLGTWKGVTYDDASDIDPDTGKLTGFDQAEYRNYIPLDPNQKLNENNHLCVVEMTPNTQQSFHWHPNKPEYGILFPGQSTIIRTNHGDEEYAITTPTIATFGTVYHTLQNSSKNDENRQNKYPWHIFLKPPGGCDRTANEPEIFSKNYEFTNIKPNELFLFGDGKPQARAILIDSNFDDYGCDLCTFFKQNKINWKYGIIIPYQGFIGLTRIDENNKKIRHIIQAKDRIQKNKIAHFSTESKILIKPIGK